MKKTPFWFFVVGCSIFALLLVPAKSFAGTQTVGSWSFSSASDFTISDSSIVKFSENSVKIIPNGIAKSESTLWRNSHFAPKAGSVEKAYGVVTDSSGNIYVSGITSNGESGTNYAFVVKLNSSYNEQWYSANYVPETATESAMKNITIDENGDIITLALYINGGSIYTRLLKIDPDNGNIIWYKDDAKAGATYTYGWDTTAGPKIDSNNNIYFAVGEGADPQWDNGEPMSIFKYDNSGNQIWNKKERLASYETGAWDDIWDLVIDSEGSIYISASADMGDRHLEFGLVKYSSAGDRVWTRLKNWGDNWEAPRGLSIDSSDNIYQNGNSNMHGLCSVIKYDKNGNVLTTTSIGDADYMGYCWGSTIDNFDSWFMPGPYSTGHSLYFRVFADADYIYATSYDRKIYVWNKNDRTLKMSITVDDFNNARSVWADSSYIYTSMDYRSRPQAGAVKVWNRGTGALIRTLTTPITGTVQVMSDANYIYGLSWDKVYVWSKSNFSYKTRIDDNYKSMANNSNYIILGGNDGKVYVYNKSNFSLAQTLTDPTGGIYAIYADSSYIYAGSIDHKVYVWDANTFGLEATLTNATDEIMTVAADASYIYAGSKDNKAYIWQKSDFSLATSKSYSSDVNSIYSDGTDLYLTAGCYDNGVYVYQTSDFSQIDKLTDISNPGIYIIKSDPAISTLSYLDDGNNDFGEWYSPPRTTVDHFGNLFMISGFYDQRYPGTGTLMISKFANSYPDTTTGTGTPLTLINKTPVAFDSALSGFSVTYGSMDQSDVGFQISPDGINWYWWNGSAWVAATGYEYNTVAEVNVHLSAFAEQFGSGDFYFKVFMITDGDGEVDLAGITISRTVPEPPAPLPNDNLNLSNLIPGLTILPETGGQASNRNYYSLIILAAAFGAICFALVYSKSS